MHTFNLGYQKIGQKLLLRTFFQSIVTPPLQTDYIEAPYKISFVLLNHLHIKRGFKRHKKDSFTDRKEREEIEEANASAIERNTEG